MTGSGLADSGRFSALAVDLAGELKRLQGEVRAASRGRQAAHLPVPIAGRQRRMAARTQSAAGLRAAGGQCHSDGADLPRSDSLRSFPRRGLSPASARRRSWASRRRGSGLLVESLEKLAQWPRRGGGEPARARRSNRRRPRRNDRRQALRVDCRRRLPPRSGVRSDHRWQVLLGAVRTTRERQGRCSDGPARRRLGERATRADDGCQPDRADSRAVSRHRVGRQGCAAAFAHDDMARGWARTRTSASASACGRPTSGNSRCSTRAKSCSHATPESADTLAPQWSKPRSQGWRRRRRAATASSPRCSIG